MLKITVDLIEKQIKSNVETRIELASLEETKALIADLITYEGTFEVKFPDGESVSIKGWWKDVHTRFLFVIVIPEGQKQNDR